MILKKHTKIEATIKSRLRTKSSTPSPQNKNQSRFRTRSSAPYPRNTNSTPSPQNKNQSRFRTRSSAPYPRNTNSTPSPQNKNQSRFRTRSSAPYPRNTNLSRPTKGVENPWALLINLIKKTDKIPRNASKIPRNKNKRRRKWFLPGMTKTRRGWVRTDNKVFKPRQSRLGVLKIIYSKRNICGTLADTSGNFYGTITTGLLKKVRGRKRNIPYNIRATARILIATVLKSKLKRLRVVHWGKTYRKKKKMFFKLVLKRILKGTGLRVRRLDRASPRSHNGSRPSKQRRR